VIDRDILRFFHRSASIQYVGTPDCTWVASGEGIDQAIQEFITALPNLSDFQLLARALGGRGSSFAIEQTVHAIPVPQNSDREIKAAIGAVIRAESGFHVDLGSPDVSITVFITRTHDPAGKIVFLISFNCTKFQTRGFKDRIAKYRPAFEIGTMNPPLTSLMVNSGHPPRDHPSLLFDPFCGTGGIMIEALVRGIASVGIDVDYPCIKGCIKNLRYYSKGRKAGFHLVHASTFSLPIREQIDSPREQTVTVTDPPYGRLESLKHASFETYIGALLRLSRSHATLCLAMPEIAADAIGAFVKKDPTATIMTVQLKREHAGFARAIMLVSRTGKK
jgi:tRNA G10  N-methylase Trm11